jgi:penicillin-binding protein 1A
VKEGETLRFFVTLEPRFQRIGEGHLKALVEKGTVPPEYEAGLVMMTGDGHVRVMVGGVDWSQRQFNTVVKSNVQPGSTAKLPLLVAACEAGKKPESRVLDLPITPAWPSNGHLGYRGETTLKEAFASSRNAAAVRLTKELGVRKVAEVSRRLGIEPGSNPDLSFPLGSFSASVLNMTSAYTAVANGGYRVTPTGVLAVVDGRGQLRANLLETTRARVIAERCIQPTRTVLSEVVRSGTGHAARLERWPAYGKTGTTTANADAWFIGWSEDRVLGIWMGKRRDAPGGALAGAGAPADLFRRIATSTNEMMEYRASREAQRNKPRVAAERHSARPNKPEFTKTPKRKVAQTKDAVRPRSEPLQRRFVPQLPPSSSWESDFWPEEDQDFRRWW